MKKFFKKVVLDVKFGLAGEGHNLSSDSSSVPQSSPSHERTRGETRSEPTVASVSAGAAALERIDRQQQQNAVNVKPRVVSAAARSSQPAAKRQEKSPGASSEQHPPSHHSTTSSTSSGASGGPTGASVAAGEAALLRLHSKDMGKAKSHPSSNRSATPYSMAPLPQATEKVCAVVSVNGQVPS